MLAKHLFDVCKLSSLLHCVLESGTAQVCVCVCVLYSISRPKTKLKSNKKHACKWAFSQQWAHSHPILEQLPWFPTPVFDWRFWEAAVMAQVIRLLLPTWRPGLNFRFQASPLAKSTHCQHLENWTNGCHSCSISLSPLCKYFLKITGFINTTFHYCFTWTFKGKFEGETKTIFYLLVHSQKPPWPRLGLAETRSIELLCG